MMGRPWRLPVPSSLGLSAALLPFGPSMANSREEPGETRNDEGNDLIELAECVLQCFLPIFDEQAGLVELA